MPVLDGIVHVEVAGQDFDNDLIVMHCGLLIRLDDYAFPHPATDFVLPGGSHQANCLPCLLTLAPKVDQRTSVPA